MIRSRGARPHLALLCGAAVLGLSAGVASGQDMRARSLTLDLSQGIEAATNPDLDENPPSDEFVLRSDIDLLYTAATRVQRLSFGIGAGLEAGRFANDSSGSRVADRRATFDYTREMAASRLAFSASYSRARVEDSEVPEDFDSDDLEITEGERGTAELHFDLETGRERRVGTEVSASLSSVRYFGNDGNGRDLADLEAALRLAVRPRTDLLLLAGVSDEKNLEDEKYESRTLSAGLGIRHALTSRQRIDAELRAMQLDRSELSDLTGEREEESETGLGGAIGYELELGRGTLGVHYDSSLRAIGRRDLLEVSHETTSEAGTLRIALGVVDSVELDRKPLVNVTWMRALPHGQLQLDLQQIPTGTEQDGQESINTSLSASYLGRINRVSSWETKLSLVDSNEFGDDAEDGRRSEVMLGYRHGLSRDWDLALRYRHILAENDNREDRDNDSLFLGLATRITLW